jgi:hypothetical protein
MMESNSPCTCERRENQRTHASFEFKEREFYFRNRLTVGGSLQTS